MFARRILLAAFLTGALTACVTTPAAPPAPPLSGSFTANGVQMAYEITGPADGAPMLLLTGTGQQMIDWPPELLAALHAQGFRTIAFDPRDMGLSQHLTAAGPADWAGFFAALQAGQRPQLAYRIEDLADDAAALLTALEIDSAHVVGVSQGGMTGQYLAIRHPDRVRSLAALMSSSGDSTLPLPANPQRMAEAGAPPAPGDRAAQIEFLVRTSRVLASPSNPADEARIRAQAVASVTRDYDPDALSRQQIAVLAGNFDDRRPALAQLSLPILALHGADDPIVPVESSRQIAAAARTGTLLIIEGMGHDLPPNHIDAVATAIAANAARAD